MNKFEIIEQIEQVKRNKNKFDNLNEYYDKINMLYHELSDIIGKNEENKQIQSEPIQQVKIIHTDELNLTDDEKKKIEKIEMGVMVIGTHSYLIENTDIKLLSKKYPLFDLFLIENDLMIRDLETNYTIQIKPIKDNYNKEKIIYEIKFLLRLCELVIGKSNKVIIVLIIFDLIFKNFNFCLDYNNFKITLKNKLKEYEDEKECFNLITNKYNMGSDIISKLLNVLNENIV